MAELEEGQLREFNMSGLKYFLLETSQYYNKQTCNKNKCMVLHSFSVIPYCFIYFHILCYDHIYAVHTNIVGLVYASEKTDLV